HCCSKLFIVNPLVAQLFIPDCSLVFINERIFFASPRKYKQNQLVVNSGTAFAFAFGSLDSK
ncbi:hypothetical protein, partial [Pseudomonas thivervalensis]|uniref:hypothetical protein n=1 Tax=Pseudomonas thivervalensis TaxID=86265 RepID=UPI001C1037F1